MLHLVYFDVGKFQYYLAGNKIKTSFITISGIKFDQIVLNDNLKIELFLKKIILHKIQSAKFNYLC
jgi:hypothetical protein